MEEDEWEGVICGRRLEEENVAVREEAAGEARTGRSVHGEAEGAEGGFAVVADADGGAEAPEETPPRAGWRRAGWRRAELGAVLGEREWVCGVGSGAEFAVDFVGVGGCEELVEEGVGGCDGEDLIGGEQGWKAFLPVVVAALDLAFGLGEWGRSAGRCRKNGGPRRVG